MTVTEVEMRNADSIDVFAAAGDRPVECPTGSEIRGTRPLSWRFEVFLLSAAFVAYSVSRLAAADDKASAAANGWAILDWERANGLAIEQYATSLAMNAPPLAVFASFFYATLHYLVGPAVLVWMYRRHPGNYRPARTSLLVGSLLGLIGFCLLPTTPPRLLQGAAIPDVLLEFSNWGWWGQEASAPSGLGFLTNQHAAMPSLHVGWAAWCGYLVARFACRRWVRLVGIVYPLGTTFVVLATGNHYLLDALAGGVVMVAGGLITHLTPRALAARRRAWLIVHRALADPLWSDAVKSGRPRLGEVDGRTRVHCGIPISSVTIDRVTETARKSC